MTGNGRLLAALVTASLAAGPLAGQQVSEVVLATPALPAGLLDTLVATFQSQGGYTVRVVTAASDRALDMGKRGDVDVVIAQSAAAEQALVTGGFFTSRALLMSNNFIIVGPRNDPVELRGGHDAVRALQRISQGYALFVSCGDRSAAHRLELDLWKRARIDPPGRGAKYQRAKGGLAATLAMADEKRAYALVDQSTLLAAGDRTNLVVLVQGDSLLANEYHLLESNPRNAARVNAAGAHALVQFLLSPEAQARLAAFHP